MNTYFFKVQYGYGMDEFLCITQEELPKAIGAFMTENSRVVFNSGATRGKEILRIVPNWHADQGWNPNHKMDEYDWMAIESKKRKYQNCYETAKKYAMYFLDNGNIENLKLPFSELRQKFKEQIETKSLVNEAVKLLADRMNIHNNKNYNEQERRELLKMQADELRDQE